MRLALAAALVVVASPALAQQQAPACLPHAILVQFLADAHKEKPASEGATDSGAAVVLFAADDGSTWTLVIRGKEVSCIIATGNSWASLKPRERGA